MHVLLVLYYTQSLIKRKGYQTKEMLFYLWIKGGEKRQSSLKFRILFDIIVSNFAEMEIDK